MKIVQINTVDFGSTGVIMDEIAKIILENGHTPITCHGYQLKQKAKSFDWQVIQVGGFFSKLFHKLRFILGLGEGSKLATKRLVKKLKQINPDVIHLHNLHGFYINYKILFDYIKQEGIKVIYTLHDCWAFTGHCPYFSMVDCKKWEKGCHHCSQIKKYPKAIIDNSSKEWEEKKKAFTNVKDMTIVTPSNWLKDLAKKSFLGEYPIKVINNGIDLSHFKPTPSDQKQILELNDKHVVLGVAFDWGVRKGLDVFRHLAKALDENYQIVMVGVNEELAKTLPNNVTAIHKTQNQIELAKLYTLADVFINPTREDNYPTVNLESLACGTPVITFNAGGSPEIIDDKCGSVVELNDLDALKSEIERVCTDKPFDVDYCVNKVKDCSMEQKFKEYLELYK